jgi:membrane protease YdiL (CAAX protease family)
MPKYQPVDLVVIFLVFSLVQGLSSLVLNQLFSPLGLTNLSILVATSLSLGVILIWQVKSRQLSLATYFNNFSLSLPQIIGLILAAGGLNILLSEVNNIMLAVFPLPDSVINQFNEFITGQQNWLFLIIIIITITTVIKEILLRGLILQGLLASHTLLKAVGSTILLHLLIEFNFYQLISTFTLSLLLNWLYLYYKSLSACILGALFYSLIPYLTILLVPYKISGYNTALTTPIQFQPLWFNLLGVLIFSLGGYLIFNTQQTD